MVEHPPGSSPSPGLLLLAGALPDGAGALYAALGGAVVLVAVLLIALVLLARRRVRPVYPQAWSGVDLLDQSHDAVLIWQLGGGIVYWNRGAEELYGWSAAEAHGRSSHDLLDSIHVIGRQALEAVLARDGRWEGEIEHSTRDGRRIIVESRHVLVHKEQGPGLILEANRDVTERKRTEAALAESAARLRAILDQAVDGIITIDDQGVIESFNVAASRLFGYRADEVLGRNLKMLMGEPYRSAHDDFLAHYRRTGERRVIGVGREVPGRRRDGSEFPIELAVSETRLGERRLFTGTVRDISARKQADAEREHLLESERAARTEAERAARMKDEFVAALSHELRTPLNAIVGWVEMLQRGTLDSAAAEKALEVIRRNARAQAQMMEDLLDVSRIVSGKLRLDVQRTDLAGLVDDAVASVLPAIEAKGIRLEKIVDPAVGAMHGDPGRLQQVVWNLLSNAIKFTPKQGRVRVVVRRTDSHADLVVSDTGRGITPDFLPYVFDRFRQADASTTRSHGGLGLGLALVRHLVELHGGTVRVESEGEGKGATFTVSLPIEAVRREAEEVGAPVDPCQTLEGVRVLVVDDDEDARELVQRMLEECHAEVVTVASAAAAFTAVQHMRPDVLLSDIGMPEQDGYELMIRVRGLGAEQGGRTPAAALTAFARPEDRLRTLRAGYQIHLAKPVDPGELITVVASLAGRWAAS